MASMQIPTAELALILQEAARQGTGTKYGFVASLTLLIYDHITTLAEEIELIWNRKFSLVTALFFVNRYYAVVVVSIIISSSIFTEFTPEVCKRMLLFQPLAGGIPLTFFPDFVVALRVYALYERNKLLAVIMACYLGAEFGVALWEYLTPSMFTVTLPGPEDVTNSIGLHSCIAQSSLKLSNLQASTFQFMQTIFDTSVLILVLYKTIKESLGPKSARGIRTIIATHGILYYFVVFGVNIAWAIMVLTATTGLKYTMAGPTIALAPLAANKLTLSLRSFAMDEKKPSHGAYPAPKGSDVLGARPSKLKRRASWIGTSTFEVTGGPAVELDTLKMYDEGSFGSTTYNTRDF
ncbi:hypothetical protein SCHPADRAFT_904396 [Schizopora paradoxa]|uniref:DUF6533 domain-containing protein n=1 Tax=Schizopora paradoxa TaxID=27342 RepID=A0A0H2S8K5_9AGAM|nr:hypothetical protein SCHPADRAFT_904396 [Schizopora paradoxa]